MQCISPLDFSRGEVTIPSTIQVLASSALGLAPSMVAASGGVF
jgi:hypothetical protein